MAEIYVARKLIADQGGTERTVSEDDILSLGFPIVVLGDAGMGKTKLTESLAARLGASRVLAGSFSRTVDLNALKPAEAVPIVIDGLDELTASSGASPVDDVLTKLSAMDCPLFILSCRAADWNGSADRHKIREDYCVEPITLRLEPFSREDAASVLSARGLDANSLLDDLDRRDLEDFYKNPLTLTLVADIAEAEQGLPDGRVDLFDCASRLLLHEDNKIHQRDQMGMASADDLLDSAGAIFAHLLLSGSLGIADRAANAVPGGYVALGELAGLPNAPLASTVIKTRLFRSSEENLFVPYHRIIAEFLAGGWLAKRLDSGLSERRAFQVLTFAGGVPTALRGLHAWFGHFAPRLTDICIRTDPYGALRYGDPEKLSLPQARLLLQSLGATCYACLWPYGFARYGRHNEKLRPSLCSETSGGKARERLSALHEDVSREGLHGPSFWPSDGSRSRCTGWRDRHVQRQELHDGDYAHRRVFQSWRSRSLDARPLG
ncbi:MAG: hypothetical protein WBQ17_12225 [Rhizomicrobium sp.]